jgi:hypothetical protein
MFGGSEDQLSGNSQFTGFFSNRSSIDQDLEKIPT